MDKTIALYMRLSDEDDNLAAHEESNSISHQRKLMLDHIQKLPELKDCNIMEFSDDGYSGADFSRPNFVKMMDLVKAGKIQVIVTKDYSRLGRDYLEVGNYMECIFPVLQVRYISVNDNYDSANSFGSTGGMSVALKNLVNALYCKDASKKVRAAKAVLAKQGKYIAAFAPFGYQKSEDDKHMLVPDPVTAPVVQLIFELAIKGMKYTEIANYLNNNGYDSIFEYYQKIGVKRCYERDIGEHMWSASTVMEILYNEVYIGSVINNKTADNIDTGHQVVQRDKEDWIIVENCHEPLVSVEDFKLAHKMIARREVTKRKPNGKWRKSYIRCGICGKGLYKYGNKSSYRCHNGHVSRIRGEELEATLLDIARNMALAQLQEFELKTDGGNCPDNLETQTDNPAVNILNGGTFNNVKIYAPNPLSIMDQRPAKLQIVNDPAVYGNAAGRIIQTSPVCGGIHQIRNAEKVQEEPVQNKEYKKVVYFEDLEKMPKDSPERKAVENVRMPNNLVFIPKEYFKGCENLKRIDIPERTVSIGDNAFEGCKSLTDINIPNSMFVIGDNAFKDCSGLSNLDMPMKFLDDADRIFSGENAR